MLAKLFFVACILRSSICLGTVKSTLPKVVVTGAAGRTGSIVFSKLLKSDKFRVVGLVKSEKSANVLKKLGASADQIALCDISDVSSLKQAFEGAEKVVLCTSAVPQINYFSILKVFVAKLFGKVAYPEFTFPPKGDPIDVDWIGSKNQIDVAKSSKVKQFVFLSSMGGTDPNNFLNRIGRKDNDENSGNILLWKRKAEKYLIDSGIPYTIIHPGGLLDKSGGEREIVFGINDELLKEKVRSIPRADVAEVCVQSLLNTNALKRSFDIISKQPGEGTVTTNWNEFFKQKGNCKY